jgi:hypothetical protein
VLIQKIDKKTPPEQTGKIYEKKLHKTIAFLQRFNFKYFNKLLIF